MKRITITLVLIIFFAGYLELFAQTTSTRTSTSSGRTTGRSSRTGTGSTTGTYDTGGADFIVAAVANMLRHPDKTVRMQAVQALVGGMTLGTTTTTGSSTNTTGIGDIFGMRGGSRTTSSSSSNYDNGGLGTTAIIPEFFTMLADPDPQIRDMVSIALDQIFGTDASLIRFMSDPDPVVRKYAVRLFVIRSQESGLYRTTTTSTTTQNIRNANDILIMRILLNMMKDPDTDVKQVATDALEKFISDLEKRYQQTMGGQQGASGVPFNR
ncbi:MAG: HEAT repeat domain-containing protein [Candidatus Omnitrophica bacterium]|nr:HEAT repeat domain-containing protein [Candidatus Omnitrophota bacterium]MCM8828750.1 HEAT repeat domain-containing protein [Candidatus Omnitrophota bacterium]